MRLAQRNLIWIVCLSFMIQGCQTLRMPTGPDVDHLPYLQNAPVVGIQVVDLRSTEKIGTIGASFLYVKKKELTPATQNYLLHFLHQQGLNAVVVPQTGDFTGLNLDALLKMEITKVGVSSFDLLLDEPEYTADSLVTLRNPNGDILSEQRLHGQRSSRAITDKGTGEAVAKTINQAILHLSTSKEFLAKLKGIKHSE